MVTRSIGFVCAFIATVLVFAVLQVSEVHALKTIEDGCRDCHSSDSSIVPDRLQFENNTSWHSLHKNFNCSACHPGSPGSIPIKVANCGACHDTTCTWQDLHENRVGPTCYECHSECFSPPPCIPQTENCNDAMDNDCDELVDCADQDCSQNPACTSCIPQTENCNDAMDNDCDELVDCADQDCSQNPACASCIPQAENCNDAMDNDCDKLVDCADQDCSQDAVCSETSSNDFSTYCASCHGIDGSGGNTAGDIRGKSARQISRAIRKVREMKSLKFLTRAQIRAIADLLGAN